jgi:hypothetical protein
MFAPEALRSAIRSRILPAVPTRDATQLADSVAQKGGGSVLAVIFFGSRRTLAQPDPFSAYDFFVVTRDYRDFYAGLRKAGALRRSPYVVAALNGLLPPNQVSIVEGHDRAPVWLKCSVVTLGAFLRDTSERRKDHFCAGRLFQPTEIVFAEEPSVLDQVVEAILRAHVITFDWIRPWLPGRFDAEGYVRTLLRVSLRGEIRPESGSRAEELFEAQEGYLTSVYQILLEGLAAQGDLNDLGGGEYALSRRVTIPERVRSRCYFAWSKARATARWAKYIVTFEGWLDYIVRKVERRTGSKIVLTSRERQFPVIFLWPRVIRFLRQKDL